MSHTHRSLARTIIEPGATLTPVSIGMSDASVFRVSGDEPRFVKVATEDAAAALRDEIARTQWLAARAIPVPQLLHIDDRGDSLAVLMAAIPGVPADLSPLPTAVFVTALGKALAAIHALPAATCPFDETIAMRLARAAEAVAAGDVDPAHFEQRNRHTAPEDLLQRLQQSPPRDTLVVLHGDCTLGNILIDDNGTVGFIDCGNAGRGERMIDLALLHADIVAHRGADAGTHFLAAYGMTDFDTGAERYCLDLYELF